MTPVDKAYAEAWALMDENKLIRQEATFILTREGWPISKIAKALKLKESYVANVLRQRKEQEEAEVRREATKWMGGAYFAAGVEPLILRMGISSLDELEQRLPELSKVKGVGVKKLEDIATEIRRVRLKQKSTGRRPAA